MMTMTTVLMITDDDRIDNDTEDSADGTERRIAKVEMKMVMVSNHGGNGSWQLISNIGNDSANDSHWVVLKASSRRGH